MPPVDSDLTLVPTPIDPGSLGVVLFDLRADQFPAFAADLRRLSGKPLEFRWLQTADDAPGRVLVRVEQPPPLVVWRAVDEKCTAYAEQVPGVCVQLGFRHPQPELLQPPTDHILLLRSHEVETLPAGEFASEIEELALDPISTALDSGDPISPIAIRFRLVPARGHEPPRLWVIRDDALAQLTAYCRSTHEQLLSRFTVAVSATSGVPCVVLRAINVKGPPPVFVGPATAYQSVLKLPNLFLPVGTRLTPPIRRDAMRAALAVQSDRLTWLHPLGDGTFRTESLPESAFRPLPEWVEYRLSDAPRSIVAWTQSHRWDFAPFVERPEPKPRPRTASNTPARAPANKPGLLSRTFGFLRSLKLQPPAPLSIPEIKERSVPIEDAVKTALDQGQRLHLARTEVSSALEHCRTLEAHFLQRLPTLKPEGHSDMWAELAAAYDAAGNYSDAALAWLNAIWGQPKPSPLWAWGWVRAEAKSARPEVKAIDPAPWLAGPPSQGTTRAMAAWVVWASMQNPIPPALKDRAAELVTRLESHEHWLPVRAAWLTRTSMARVGTADALGLARTRDRLAERLLTAGLSLELDTPSFLRFAGEGVRERFHEARSWLKEKRDLIRQWIDRLPDKGRYRSTGEGGSSVLRHVGLEPDVANTQAYADLILAWGLTRFADYNGADQLRKQSAAALPSDDPVHTILREGFEFRILQVWDGKPPRGPLPDSLVRRIESLEDGRYAVDKLREHLRILEPTVRVGGYDAAVHRKADPRGSSPSRFISNLPADRLDEESGKLLAAELTRDGRPHLAELVEAILSRAFELGEPGAAALINALPAALDAARDSPRTVARLIEKGFSAAAMWDRIELARYLSNRFLEVAGGRAGWDIAEGATGQAFRCLRRLGLKQEADTLLHDVAERVLQGQPIGRVRSARPSEWPAALRVLLHAAAGWYFAGNDEDAHKILEEARRDLFAPETADRDRTKLALAYATTLGQAPARIALGRLEEVFQHLKGIEIEGSTNQYYTLQPLVLIEAAVRAVVSDEFAVGPQVRAWLDADELAVRRRIRDELKAVLATQGL
jgi:hypothetical protein